MTKAAQKKPAPPEDLVEIITDVEQGSDEWRALRLGVPTASRFATIMASGKNGDESKTRRTLMNQLAGEILSGEPAETYQSKAMLRGIEMEPEARAYYARMRFVTIDPIGFIRRTVQRPLGSRFVVGCSPDSQVGPRKGLEIKTMQPDLLIEVIQRGAAGFPPEHRAQCQGTMWVAGWDEIDLMLFYRGMPVAPTFTVRRDDAYIAQLSDAVETFAYELTQLVKRIREMGR